jgi:hypothetical protein
MIRVLVALCFLHTVVRAEKPSSFEVAAAGAETVTSASELAYLLSPLFLDEDGCKADVGDDELAVEQCLAARDAAAARLPGRTFVALGDDSALSFAPWDPAEKKLELELHGCLACTRPLSLSDGKPRFVTTRVPKAISAKQHKVVGLDLGFHDIDMASDKAANEWLGKMKSRLRVQFVFKVGPVWKSGAAFEGVTFVPIAHRVVDRCSGKIIVSEPASNGPTLAQPAALRDATCPDELSEDEQKRREFAARPEKLTTKQINQVMSKARQTALDCFTEFEEHGAVAVHMIVDQSGTIETLQILAPHDKSAVGFCVRNAIRNAGLSFPKFRGEKMKLNYPFSAATSSRNSLPE